jgi:hypothetical protein
MPHARTDGAKLRHTFEQNCSSAMNFVDEGFKLRSSGSFFRPKVIAAPMFLVWKPNTDQRVAIEVQHSYLSAPDIERRTKAYMAAGVPVIWIGLLKWTQSPNGDCEPAYRSRDWEDWAHELNGGHLWLLDLDRAVGKMWRM